MKPTDERLVWLVLGAMLARPSTAKDVAKKVKPVLVPVALRNLWDCVAKGNRDDTRVKNAMGDLGLPYDGGPVLDAVLQLLERAALTDETRKIVKQMDWSSRIEPSMLGELVGKFAALHDLDLHAIAEQAKG